MNTSVARLLFGALGIGALAGCATTYVGQKLPPDGQLTKDAVTGIPFVMTRPEFSVDIAPDASDATKAVYTLKQKDVPDRNHRYTIALDPALLVDGALDLTFGELGNLTGATATSTSRVIATLESAVSFVINRNAGGAAKDMSSVLGQYRKLLTGSDKAACTAQVKEKEKKREKEKEKKPVTTALVIDGTIEALLAKATIEQASEADPVKAKAKASSLAAARFHYADSMQKACLETLVADARADRVVSTKAAQDTYDKALLKAQTAATDEFSKAWIATLAEAVKALDVAAVEKLEKSSVPSDVKAVSGNAKSLINASIDASRLETMAEQFAYMTPEVWRARHLVSLERRIKQRRLDVLIADKGGGKLPDPQLVQLEREWASTLGEPKVALRIVELDKFLTEIRIVPGGPGSGARYAAADHVQLREERDKLQDRLDKARNELVAKNKVIDPEPDKKKVEPRTDVAVRLVRQSFVDTVAANPGAVKDLPDYVLVVEPIPSTAVLLDPVIPKK